MSKHDEPRVLGHADEADGIEEYDNPLPDWWLGLFWFTIVWAFGYGVHYHFIGNRSQEGHLATEMAAAEARWPEQARAALAFTYSDDAATAGETVYAQNCFPCHGVNLEGGIGPSFVDAEWIHGGTVENIQRIIREGVPAKGMVAWEAILTPEQVNNVTAYIVAQNMQATGRDLESFTATGVPDPTLGGDASSTGDTTPSADASGSDR